MPPFAGPSEGNVGLPPLNHCKQSTSGTTKRGLMIIRMRPKKLGGHVHCDVFIGKAKNMTFAKSGDLVLREEEWDEFRNQLNSAVEFIPMEDAIDRAGQD